MYPGINIGYPPHIGPTSHSYIDEAIKAYGEKMAEQAVKQEREQIKTLKSSNKTYFDRIVELQKEVVHLKQQLTPKGMEAEKNRNDWCRRLVDDFMDSFVEDDLLRIYGGHLGDRYGHHEEWRSKDQIVKITSVNPENGTVSVVRLKSKKKQEWFKTEFKVDYRLLINAQRLDGIE